MAASGGTVAFTFGVQIGLAIAIFLLFSWLRLTGWARRFYAPKRFDSTIDYKPRRLPPGLFGWMITVLTYPEADMIRSAGLDSAMAVRVLRMGWEVFTKVTLVTCIIILPINLSGNEVSTLLFQQNAPPPPAPPPPPIGCANLVVSDVKAKKYEFTTFDKCSLANIESGSAKMWAHLLMVYVVTGIVLTTLDRYNKKATLLRLAFLANSPRGGPSHTVLITDIPGIRYGTFSWYLRGIASSTLFLMLPERWKRRILDFVEKGVGQVVNLDIAAAVGQKGRLARPPPKIGKPEAAPDKVDAIAKIAEANTRAAEEEEAAKSKVATGVIRRRRRADQEFKASDDALDPWKQAGEVLGDMNQPDAGKVKHLIHQEVEATYGTGCVAAVNPVWDQDDLNPLVGEYTKVRQQLEDYLDHCTYKLRRRKKIKKRRLVTVVGPTYGAWGVERYGVKPVKVDAIDFWCARLRWLSEAIPPEQQECLEKAIPAAFVTVNTRATQVTLSNTLHHHDETTWRVQGAPEPREILWGNLSMRAWERALRTIVLWAAYVVLLLFYLIPIAAVQGLVQAPKLAKVPVLGMIINWPVVKQIVEGILPGLVLLIFLAILPAILAVMCRLSGFVSTSQVDFGVVTRFFGFQVVALFLGSLIAGSLFNQLKQFVQNPGSIITILGTAVPMTSTFFITYILVAGIGKSGLRHLRIPKLVLYFLLSKVAATPRARARLWQDQYALYGNVIPDYTIAFLLGLVYCCINPIVCPTVLIYFTIAIISESYNSLYVYKRPYESGGRLWYYVFNQFMVALYFMQVVMAILLALKKFKLAPLLIPAIVFTLGYHVSTLNLFSRPWNTMSAHDAAMLDQMDQEERGTGGVSHSELQQIQEMYLSPVFKIQREDVDDLLREAEVVDRQIKGEHLQDIEADLEERQYHSADELSDHEDEEAPPPGGGGAGGVGGKPAAYVNGSRRATGKPTARVAGSPAQPATPSAASAAGSGGAAAGKVDAAGQQAGYVGVVLTDSAQEMTSGAHAASFVPGQVSKRANGTLAPAGGSAGANGPSVGAPGGAGAAAAARGKKQ